MRGRWTGVWPVLAFGLALPGVRADVSALPDSPYRVILERNAFGLKDPPPPPAAAAPTNPVVPKSTVQLSGISVSKQGTYALLVLPVGPGRTNTTYLRLRADPSDQQSGIEVLEIDTNERRVKIRNAGITESLSLTNNAPPLVAAPVGPGVGGVPGAVPAPGRPTIPMPGQPSAVPVPTPGVPSPSIPTALPVPAVQRVGVSPSVTPMTPVIPGGSVGGPAVVAGAATPVPARPIRTEEAPSAPPEVQYLMMKAQEEASRSAGVPFPPTPPLPP